MSCNHRYGPGYWHGCYGPPPPEWYDDYGYGYRPRRYRDEVVDYDDDEEGPLRRRGSSRRRRWSEDQAIAAAATPISLQERAVALRDELARVEEELAARSQDAPVRREE
jgi:hypothetical protein